MKKVSKLNYLRIIHYIAKIPTLNQMRHKKAEDKKYAFSIITKFRKLKRPQYILDKSSLNSFSDYSTIQLESILSMICSIEDNHGLNVKLIDERLK